MTVEELNRFPALWERFVRQLQDRYIKILTAKLMAGKCTFYDELSKAYDQIGWEYWCVNDGEAVRWMQRYGERFFENRLYPLRKMLYDYPELDALVRNSLKQEREALVRLQHIKQKLRIALYAKKLYASAIKPHLFARRQAVMTVLFDAKQELLQPSEYILYLPLKAPMQLHLTFATCYRKFHFDGPLENYRYSFNGRSHRGIETLWQETVEELSKDVFIGWDAHGEKVLKTYTGFHPIDSEHRKWDSRILKYLIFDGKEIHLVIMRGGYRIANLTFYKKLLTADVCMKPVFAQLGWPETGIIWI